MAADPTALDINRAIEDDPMGRFYERDPHWSAAGRVAVAELIVEHFAPGLWEANAVRTAEERLLQGMDRFLGVNDISVLPDLVVERDVVLEHVAPQAYGLGLLIFQQSRAEGDAVIPGTTYIFGDSQMASVIPYVDQYFEELIFVGWLRAALGPLPPTLPAPDRVFVEALDQWAIDSFESPVLASVIDRLKTE